MNGNITSPDIPTITATATHMISIPTPTEIKMIFLFMMEVCSLCFPIRTDNKMTCGGFMIEVLSSCKGRFIIVHFYSPKSVLEMTVIFVDFHPPRFLDFMDSVQTFSDENKI